MNTSAARFQEALTYDDLLMRPAASNVVPSEVQVASRLTQRISLAVPLVSAPMDTVTESLLAIALAQQGGVGIIHRNLSIQDQVKEVQIVKRAANGIVNDPIELAPQATLADAVGFMKAYSVSSFPIVENGNIVGIITNRDLRFEIDLNKPVSSLMTTEVVTAPERTNLDQAKQIMSKHKIEKLVIVDGQKRLRGLICMKDILDDINFPLATKDKDGRLRVGAACGASRKDRNRVSALVEAGTDVVVVDTAHGHHSNVLSMVRWVKKTYPELEVVGGNVATREGCLALVDAGADAVKVGVGPGSICTTRIVAGVGVPQATALMEAVEVAKERDIPVIADGGIKYSGDLAKALALGASSVMIGSLFAGTKQAPGEQIYYQGRTYKTYRGMGSLAAMSDGSHERYLQGISREDPKKFIPEGVEGGVPLKGDLSEVVFQLIGGLKSAMGYCGAENLKTLAEKASFVRITQSGLQESHVHNVIITKEPPNYSQQ